MALISGQTPLGALHIKKVPATFRFFGGSADRRGVSPQEEALLRRKFPRRGLKKSVGMLHAGKYSLVMGLDVGEGGMSIQVDRASVRPGELIVLNFQIPRGHFMTVRALVRSQREDRGVFTIGVSFEDIPPDWRREIRIFVTARTVADH